MDTYYTGIINSAHFLQNKAQSYLPCDVKVKFYKDRSHEAGCFGVFRSGFCIMHVMSVLQEMGGVYNADLICVQ